MTRGQLSSLCRLLGYVISISCLAYALIRHDSSSDALGGGTDAQALADETRRTFLVILGCALGVAFAIVGVLLRYWPAKPAKRPADRQSDRDA